MSKQNMYRELAEVLSLLSHLGIVMLVCIFGCMWAGKWIDTRLGSEPVFTIMFIFLGIGSGFISIYKVLYKYIERKK